MRPLIGVISWLPPDEPRRSVRRARAIDTLRKCRDIFPSVPVLVIAQDWGDADAALIPSGVSAARCAKLGILGARRELRSRFMRSGFDCLIMLDDDCDLSGTRADGDAYLAELRSHPGCFGERAGTALKMLSVCREVFIDYPDVDPEAGDGYEDRAFVGALRASFPERRFAYGSGPLANDDATSDPYTTWDRTPMRNRLGAQFPYACAKRE